MLIKSEKKIKDQDKIIELESWLNKEDICFVFRVWVSVENYIVLVCLKVKNRLK